MKKSAGFIKSEKLDFKLYAWGDEARHTTIDTSNKYVVTVRESPGPGDYPAFPRFVTGAIRIYTIDTVGALQIRVSIDDLASNDHALTNVSSYGYSKSSYYEIHSLGNLERDIADYIIGLRTMPKCHFALIR